MKKKPLVSVIIVNWHGLVQTKRCLQSLKKVKWSNFQVIVVDNSSTKREFLILNKEFGSGKKFKVIHSGENIGFAAGCNLGARYASGKYFLFLNNDTEVEPGFLTPLVKVLENQAKVAVCQPKIKSLAHKEYFEYAGAAGGFLDIFGYPFAQGRIFFEVEKDEGQYDQAKKIFWASGTALIIRASVWRRIGGFDDFFFAYAEEVDLCWRIQKLGYRILYVPQSVVYHAGAASWNKVFAQKIYLVHRNHLLLLLKHYPLGRLVWVLPLRILMDYGSILYYFWEKKAGLLVSVLKAHFYLFTHPRVLLQARKRAGQEKSKEYQQLIYRGSVVWNYFILKGKKPLPLLA